ncbi:RluA family pseudouridine synthase [Trinickia diaoshuihuensis]|uniref:RluA family pseudouridine synthase n=1 Tax=Trinickia diaoshuihuensis TaxID=2292265 RepID=UPI000E276238|nr:RluA family pseudouridine synthase [Trinickia diaoshuihuensis]
MTRTRPSGNMLGPIDESADYSRSGSPADAPADKAGASRLPGAANPSDDAPRVALVPAALAGERLDKVLAKVFPEYSRSRLQSWTEAGRVLLNGAPAKVRQAVPLDARIELTPDRLPEQLAFTPEPVPLEVVYEDETLVVLNKPAGLVVHPAAGNWSGTILNGLLHRYPDAAGLPRAGIVHRLDKETSGLMVVARTLEAQTDLVRQLQARTVKRRYVALVWGAMPGEGIIDAPIGRDPRERTRMAVVAGASGKAARTRFRLVDQTMWKQQTVSAVHCDLETGRTHQIRVHCAHVGHPLLGDPVYGSARGRRSSAPLPGGFTRQALHAWQLGLVHPGTGRSMRWRADLPEDMAELVQALGFGQDAAQFEDGEFDDDTYDESEAMEIGYEDEDDEADIE